jgi:hypothetical protein
MYSNDDLDSAEKAGVLSSKDVTAFRQYVSDKRVTPVVDEEYFRLITGFNDIFVVIACVLLLTSVMWIGKSESVLVGTVLQTVAAWGLAEYFTGKRRMALPSILLLLAFVGGVLGAGVIVLSALDLSKELTIAIASAVAVFAAWLHWQRFKVPITIAAGTAALVSCVMMAIFALVPQVREWIAPIIFLAGIAVFVLAMRWDSSDITRQTRRSDVAFWLHLIAAPLLVHPIFSALNVFDGDLRIWQASFVTMLYIGIAIISITIDRRAMMVSALIYVLYAFNSVLEQYGIVSLGFAFTAFGIGSGLLLLSAFWHGCRKALIPLLPVKIISKLPALH